MPLASGGLFTADLIQNAPAYGVEGCRLCLGLGIVFDPQGAGPTRGAFTVCECLKASCLCEGRPPYDYYNAEKNAMLPCVDRQARLALDRIAFFRRKSAIPGRYQDVFLDLSLRYDHLEGPARTMFLVALDEAREVVKTYQSQPRGLYLYGPTGSGKTLLSCAILNEILRLYQTGVQYAKISRDVLGKLKATFNPNSENYGEGQAIEERLARVPALVIDDFGVHRESPWVNSVLYDLIDARYENQLLTILTSNEPLDSWKEISGGRVYSRLHEMCRVVHIETPDYRLRDEYAPGHP